MNPTTGHGPPALPDEVISRLLAMVNDPDLQNNIALEASERTDPWKWYCRICGSTGEDPSRIIRNDLAMEHTQGCPEPGRLNLGTSESGRLLHVWAY